MRRVRPVLACLVIGTVTLPAAAQFGMGGGGSAEVWNNNCASCHGRRGEGGGAGTSSLLDGEYLAGGSHRDLFRSTKEGMPESGMPAFGETMSDPQIWAMVNYIRELQYRDRREREGSPRPDAQGVFATQHHRFRIEPVIESGVQTPWGVAFLPDGRMLVTEKRGTLRIHSTGRRGGTLSTPVAGTPEVRNRGQGGLMDVAVHPDYAENGWVYLAFSHQTQSGARSPAMTKIVRGRIKEGADGGAATWADEETVWEAKPEHYVNSDLHYGCRIVFDPPGRDGRRAGHIYFAIGERGMGQHAQDLMRPNGKVHRVEDDGSIPRDNPFVGREGAYASIWSYGHRNPQGLAFDAEGNLWSTEHGPRGGDELNLVLKERNYGWPLVSYGINYNGAPLVTPWPDVQGLDPEEFEMPVHPWLPSIAACGLSVGGVTVEAPGGKKRDAAFASWHGDLFAGGLAAEVLDRVRVRAGEGGAMEVAEREEILHGMGRIRDVKTGPDGSIYVVFNGPDRVARLVEVE